MDAYQPRAADLTGLFYVHSNHSLKRDNNYQVMTAQK